MNISNYIEAHKTANKKMLALLLDPDDYASDALLSTTLFTINKSAVNFILIGGSVLTTDVNFNEFVQKVKSLSAKPIVLFPGNGEQLSKHADAILLLSLVSGRDAKYLIEEHVNYAFALKASKLEILPTGYILIDAGHTTSVTSVTNTTPIAAANTALASATALAATQLGMPHIYLEAGSGANNAVNIDVIKNVANELKASDTLWVGGGITLPSKALQAWKSGANVVVVGNAAVNNVTLIEELSTVLLNLNQ
jgi:phosphoglycerol geranylgeranyltransferase